MSLSIGEVFRAVADGRMSAADGARILMGLRPESIPVPRETLERVREALRMVVSRKGGSFGALSECQDPCADALADLDRLLRRK